MAREIEHPQPAREEQDRRLVSWAARRFMWLTIIGIAAAVLILVAVLGVIAVRALRKFVRAVWPHS